MGVVGVFCDCCFWGITGAEEKEEKGDKEEGEKVDG